MLSNIRLLFVVCLGLLLFLTAGGAFAAVDQPASSSQPSSSSPDANQKMGDAYMQSNKNKKGVVTLPSGLQYEVIEMGNGKKPSSKDTVTVDYEGKLLSGQVFDSSYQRGQSATFPVSGVISGWQEALQLMPIGSTWILTIPPNLAYGNIGAGGVIGPNETLIFKVHLIGIQ